MGALRAVLCCKGLRQQHHDSVTAPAVIQYYTPFQYVIPMRGSELQQQRAGVFTITYWVGRVLNADWLTAVVYFDIFYI